MLIVCPQCGFSRNVSKDRLKGRYVTVTCPKCQCRFRMYSNGVVNVLKDRHNEGETEEDRRIVAARAYAAEQRRWEEEKAPVASAKKIAWDAAPESIGWLDAFFQTVLGVMFTAQKFFPRLNPLAPLYRALGFYLVICVFQIIVERLWLEGMLTFFNTATLDDPQLKELLAKITPESGFALSLLLRTAFYAFQLYIFSFLMEFAFRLAAPGKSTFSLVFQILAYSSAPHLLCIIPGLGSLAGLVWSLGCVAIGCKIAMNIKWSQVLIGFLPPFCLVLPLLYSLFGMLAR